MAANGAGPGAGEKPVWRRLGDGRWGRCRRGWWWWRGGCGWGRRRWWWWGWWRWWRRAVDDEGPHATARDDRRERVELRMRGKTVDEAVGERAVAAAPAELAG